MPDRRAVKDAPGSKRALAIGSFISYLFTNLSMRICLFTPSFFPRMGGQEMVVDQLARHFSALGHEVVVFSQHASRRGSKTEVKVPYRLKRFSKTFSQVWGIGGIRHALARLHRAWNFDVIHSHSCYPTGYAALPLCREKKIPLVVTSHGGDLAEDSRFRSRPQVMKRSRQTLEQADAVTAISSYMKKWILDAAPDCEARLHSIPNGVDCAALSERVSEPPEVARRHELTPDSFLLFLGRLHRRKGVEVLLEAFCETTKRHSNARLVVAGEGDELERLRAQAKQTGSAEKIQFVGAVAGADKLWLLQNAQCLVLPTPTRETFGLVLLEAMANGKPVIGTNLGGIVDLINDGQNGFLVPPGNAPALSDAMEKIICNQPLREKLGNNAIEKAAAFDWPQVARKYIALFEKLLKTTRPENVPA